MNYTENYHLPQWVKTDRIMMDDFNQMCADIEEGLTGNRTEAAEAKAEAAKMPYVVGTYIGAEETLHISIGFRPSFLIVSGMGEGKNETGGSGITGNVALTGGNLNMHHKLQLTDDGFTVFSRAESGYFHPNLTSGGCPYDYIAFR